MNACSKGGTAEPRWRASLRLALGLAQVIGASMTIVLLLQEGVATLVIWGVALTGLVSLTSILLIFLTLMDIPVFTWTDPEKGRVEG